MQDHDLRLALRLINLHQNAIRVAGVHCFV
jgi:hypothetical protein